MEVHLIDGTYELFRHFYALPSARDSEGREVAAVRGVLGSLLGMMQAGKTYIGVATDHVIESFRNRMWPGYKTGQGVDPELLAQFPLLEETLEALGVVVWAMEEYEADDALASAAFLAGKDPRVKRVVISTPDKDLAQCVQGTRVVQLDRRRRLERDEEGVVQKFGVKPRSIPDYLALVGDTADGYPGLPGWGAKSASAVLSRFGRLEAIPPDAKDWQVNVSNRKSLSEVFNSKRDLAFLFRDLAMLRPNLPLFATVDDLLWTGPTPDFPPMADRLDKAKFSAKRVPRSREDGKI
ncbi:5'-3' exonuclease H3TH domain-containing protein [Tunturiibacter empetritectus]|uniref:5'-3' exonuclease n=2 Tax=Tunturiibacter TaxID=3154218 RepID=A0A852VH30_9BACT|nr:5'-3' exonuclease H3TH domain-containing protein [Edaphobacter lichenicola]NYF90359.1 5'-3' exonuclease [Edaphobacter lichenicola]